MSNISNGKIIAIDKKPMEKVKNVNFIKGDFLTSKIQSDIKENFGKKIDVVISDMAADTTGNKSVDCIRTNNLCLEVINFSLKILENKGTLVSKLFMGEEFIEVKDYAKKKFKKVEFYKPQSSRRESKETYIICSIIKTL